MTNHELEIDEVVRKFVRRVKGNQNDAGRLLDLTDHERLGLARMVEAVIYSFDETVASGREVKDWDQTADQATFCSGVPTIRHFRNQRAARDAAVYHQLEAYREHLEKVCVDAAETVDTVVARKLGVW